MNTDKKEKPNVYYIILDAYPSPTILSKAFSFDNSEFDNWLTEKGFYVYPDAQSNYPETRASLASMFAMDYVHNFFKVNNSVPIDANRFFLVAGAYNSAVFRIFRELGYTYYHIINHWENEFLRRNFDCADRFIDIMHTGEYDNFIQHVRNIGGYTDNIAKRFVKLTHIRMLQELENIAKDDILKFVYCHIICPHEPFCFDRNGNFPDNDFLDIVDNENKKSTGIKREYFLNQLVYVNELTKKTVVNLLKDDPNSIIILEADHGVYYPEAGGNFIREKPSPIYLNSKFSTYRAIYAPKDFDFEFGSLVNLFRSVINYVSGSKMPYLPDVQYYSTYDDHYFDFKPVPRWVFDKFKAG